MSTKEYLKKLNSFTKYPSIKTYHVINKEGRLENEVKIPFDEPVILTEKIDGVNGRITIFPSGFYLIGSREEWLYAKDDLIGNPQLGIIDVLKPVAEKILCLYEGVGVTTYYFEVFGGKTTKNGKQYTGNGAYGCRLFDISFLPNSEYKEILKMPIERISAWREAGGQRFYEETKLIERSRLYGVELTPRIGISSLPTDINETSEWLKKTIQNTKAALDNGAGGKPEGIVARTSDRSKIAKLRFDDYRRSLTCRA
jgi:hypothetical protein